MESNLLDYLIKNSDEYTSKRIYLIKYELGCKTSYFGEHWNSPTERNKTNILKHNLLRDYAEFFATKFFKKIYKSTGKKKILSSANLLWNNNIREKGYYVERPPWTFRRDLQIDCTLKLYLLTKKIERKFQNSDFNYLTSKDFFLLIDNYLILLRDFCKSNSYDALILSQYNGFFEKAVTKIFRELDKPVIFWHHGGIPANYDVSHQSRADYFVLMGQRQVDDYIKVGYSPSKFLVAGHPIYNELPNFFRFEFDSILVITKSGSGYSPLETSTLDERGNSLMYLESIKKVLKKIGIRKVFLRSHPGENYNWYKKFIDNDFYMKDEFALTDSLKRSTLVVGPISTTIIDSMYHGVNYVVYEPVINDVNSVRHGRTILGQLVTPPLDGKDSRFPVAHSEEELEKILRNKKKIALDIYNEFSKTTMNIDFLKNII